MRLFLITVLLVPSFLYAQTNTQKVENYFDSLALRNEFSGYILIAEKGKPVFQKGFGYADRDNKFPNTGSSQFCLSSTSKLFTATAIVKLIQERKINANDTIGKYISGLTYGHQVTIHQLLTHSSGLSDFFEDPTFSYEGVTCCTDLIKYISSQSLHFTPGEKVKYSTTGMILLGAVIEKVSGLTYEKYLTKEFFIPLNMNNTSFVGYGFVQYKEIKPSSYSIGYIKDSTGNIVIRRRSWDSEPFMVLSAGGIWSSAEDLLKFDQALYSGKILNKKYLKLMIENKVPTEWNDGSRFGYGWINVNNGKNIHAVGHAGNAGAHHNTFFHYDINSTTVIIMTNYGFVDIFQLSMEVEKRMFD